MVKRNGKPLTVLADGHPRRLADGRNAARKMNTEQRATFLRWFVTEEATEADREVLREALEQ